MTCLMASSTHLHSTAASQAMRTFHIRRHRRRNPIDQPVNAAAAALPRTNRACPLHQATLNGAELHRHIQNITKIKVTGITSQATKRPRVGPVHLLRPTVQAVIAMSAAVAGRQTHRLQSAIPSLKSARHPRRARIMARSTPSAPIYPMTRSSLGRLSRPRAFQQGHAMAQHHKARAQVAYHQRDVLEHHRHTLEALSTGTGVVSTLTTTTSRSSQHWRNHLGFKRLRK
jgi:hypothetical protein